MIDWVRRLTCSPDINFSIEVEDSFFKAANIELFRYFVELDGVKIWTGSNIKREDIKNIDYDRLPPILLIHGILCNLGIWINNLEILKSQGNPLFAIDMPGFGLSSRVSFPTQAKEIEAKFCYLLNLWQSAMGLEKIIIIGHSFGAYVSCCYTMLYPENVISLVLIDPWGFLDTHSYTVESVYNYGFGFIRKSILSARFFWLSFIMLIRPFLLTDIIRIFGFKYASLLINHFYSNILSHFSKDMQFNGREICSKYLFSVNCFSPTGEIAFSHLLNQYFMAKSPLIHRIDMLSHLKKLYFIFGENSYLDCIAGLKVQQLLENTKTYVHVIPKARHLPHIESSDTFNGLIFNILKDLNSDSDN